jgi:hypothetical protein
MPRCHREQAAARLISFAGDLVAMSFYKFGETQKSFVGKFKIVFETDFNFNQIGIFLRQFDL